MSGSRGKGKKASFKDRQGISYVEAADPPFLAQLKSKMGYREYKVEDKFDKDDEGEEDTTEDRDDIRNLREEERPQVVVLDPKTDISADELLKEIQKRNEEEDKRKILEGKITFRKPEKRESKSDGGEEKAPTSSGEAIKRARKEDEKREAELKKAQEQAQSRRLLSFGNDEDED